MTEKKQFRWSFSQWEAYNQCPAKWHFANILKLPRLPPGPAAARGIDMHDRVENYIMGHINVEQLRFGNVAQRFGGKKPAIIAQKYVPVLDEYRLHPNGDRHTELKCTFDEDWCQTGQSDKTWAVAVLDAARVLGPIVHVGEWKSGQPKDTHADQRKMYGITALRRWIGIQEAHVTTYYLEDTAPPARLVVKASAEDKLRALWKDRTDQMQKDQICAPRPGDYCRYMCDFAAGKGGPCQYGA